MTHPKGDSLAERHHGGPYLRLWVDRVMHRMPGFRFLLASGPRPNTNPDKVGVFQLVDVPEDGSLFKADGDPGFSLTEEAVQDLMDELWRMGFRPSVRGDRGDVEGAMRAHLLDLRAIVAKKLGVDLPTP